MSRLNYDIKIIGRSLNIMTTVSLLISGKKEKFYIPRAGHDEWPVKFWTCTTDIRDFIANTTQMHDTKCSVKGVYRGYQSDLHNVRICDKVIKNINERVMVMEHLDVNGNMELIATKKRVLLDGEQSGINFLNVGWSNEVECKYLRIDIYTGECKEIVTGPNFSYLHCKET